MQHSKSLAERPLGIVIGAIASDDVAPGAGSAAAVGLALAAACAGKAVAISRKHQTEDTELARAQDVLAQIAQRALCGADEDASRFRAFIREQDAPSAENLLESTRGLRQLGVELLEVLEGLTGHIHASVCGDITAARALCRAFIEIQSENLSENRDAAARHS
jgi:formiminotetrahydrofolate cyclodeaminase